MQIETPMLTNTFIWDKLSNNIENGGTPISPTAYWPSKAPHWIYKPTTASNATRPKETSISSAHSNLKQIDGKGKFRGKVKKVF